MRSCTCQHRAWRASAPGKYRGSPEDAYRVSQFLLESRLNPKPQIQTFKSTPCALHSTHLTSNPNPKRYTMSSVTSNPNPKRYTLLPTPYTLHPAPYTLHPAPCTLHPPCTLLPAPYTLLLKKSWAPGDAYMASEFLLGTTP